MADLYTAIANNVAHTGASADKTTLQVATPSTRRIQVVEAKITFDGVTATNVPCEIRVQRQTTSGTGGVALATNYGINALDPAAPASLCSALKGIWATTEPTASSIVEALKVSPTAGVIYQIPLGNEVVVPVSGFIGIVVNAANAVNIWAQLKWTE